MDRKPYSSDLTDEQWALLEPLLPPAKPGGRPRSADLREVVNGILYLLRTGCPWRALPHDLPPWGTVWAYFRRWRDDGTLDRLHDDLRASVRTEAGREADPSAAILDSQSVKTAERGGRAATTLARRFRGASATLSSIPWD
jgi:putative transposase